MSFNLDPNDPDLAASAAAEGLFAVACPHCHAAVSIARDLADLPAACPICRGHFLVPHPQRPPQPEPQPEPQPQPQPEPQPQPATSAAAQHTPAGIAEPPPPAGLSAEPADFLDRLELPEEGPAPIDPALAVHEADRTIATDHGEVTVRRLTREERSRRRLRRNLVMLLVGLLILMAIVVVLGRP